MRSGAFPVDDEAVIDTSRGCMRRPVRRGRQSIADQPLPLRGDGLRQLEWRYHDLYAFMSTWRPKPSSPFKIA